MLYMCMNCGTILDPQFVNLKKTDLYEYICPVADCGGTVINIDEMMIAPIQELNKKGYETVYCCSGHMYGTSHPYIAFAGKLPESVPKDWFLDEEYKCIRYRLKTIPLTPKRTMELCEIMVNLHTWVTSLPTREIEKED